MRVHGWLKSTLGNMSPMAIPAFLTVIGLRAQGGDATLVTMPGAGHLLADVLSVEQLVKLVDGATHL